jgi:hypothetical protein
MVCHSTPYTTSGTFCCNSTDSDNECQASATNPPRCPSASFQCTEDVGGGCCPDGTACSPDGCIEFEGSGTPAPITSIITTTRTYMTASKVDGSSSNNKQTQSSPNHQVTAVVSTYTMVIGGPSKYLCRHMLAVARTESLLCCIHSNTYCDDVQTRSASSKGRRCAKFEDKLESITALL